MAQQSIHGVQDVRIRTLTMHSVIAPENFQFINNHQVRFNALNEDMNSVCVILMIIG